MTDEKNKPQPIILANKTTTSKKGIAKTICIALQPAATNLIKQGKNINLIKAIMPEGEVCE
jgi:hypothetical protein